MTDVERYGLFVGGEFVPAHSGATFPVHNPHNDEVFAQVAEAREADVEDAIAAARSAFEGPWGSLTPKERGKLLLRLARLIQDQGESISRLEAKNSGHPIRDVRRFDLVRTVDWFEYVAGAALARHPGVDKICFTGSVKVGQQIMREAATNLKRPLLELGGKGPNIIFDDADLDAAVQGSLFAAFHNQGQACIAGSRILLHESIWDKFLDSFLPRIRSLRIGDPLDEKTQMGPLTSKDHQKRVLEYVDIAKGEAAKLGAGMVWINSYKLVDPASPFGGMKMSGIGREMGFETMREYTQVKSVWVGYDFEPWHWPE